MEQRVDGQLSTAKRNGSGAIITGLSPKPAREPDFFLAWRALELDTRQAFSMLPCVMMGTHQPQKDLFSYGVDLDRRVRQGTAKRVSS